MTYEKEQKSRIITLDIETVSLTPDPDGCFEAMTGRIASIALLIDNGYELRPVVICDQDERKILESFWANISRDSLLVGHNLLEFDIKFIRQRSWILNVKPSIDVNLRKYYTEDVFDVMQVWTNWGYKMKGAGLDNIAKALGLGGKNGHGSEVAQLWAAKEYTKLMDYNLSDTLVTYQCYCRMTYRQPLSLAVAQGVALPTFLLGDVREPVPVPAQQKGPQALMTLEAPVSGHAANTASVPQQSNGKREPVFYRQAGGEIILSGKGIFPIKDTIKKVYKARGNKISAPDERPARFEWHMRQGEFQSFAEWCQARGTPLYAQGNGTLHLPQGAA